MEPDWNKIAERDEARRLTLEIDRLATFSARVAHQVLALQAARAAGYEAGKCDAEAERNMEFSMCGRPSDLLAQVVELEAKLAALASKATVMQIPDAAQIGDTKWNNITETRNLGSSGGNIRLNLPDAAAKRPSRSQPCVQIQQGLACDAAERAPAIEVGRIPWTKPYVGGDLMVRIHILELENHIMRERSSERAEGYERGQDDAADTWSRRMGELQSKYETLAAAARSVPSPGFARQTKEGWADLVRAVSELRVAAAEPDENGEKPRATSGRLLGSFPIPTEPPAPKTSVTDAAERNGELLDDLIDELPCDSNAVTDGHAGECLYIIERFRQAVRAEGYEAGVANRQFVVSEKLRLQSQLKRLTGAARALLSETDNVPLTRIPSHTMAIARGELRTVLAEVSGKNGGGE